MHYIHFKLVFIKDSNNKLFSFNSKLNDKNVSIIHKELM